MNIKLPETNCERDDCLFTITNTMRTLLAYTPRYDKLKNNINPDGNITYGRLICEKCYREWKFAEQYNNISYSEIDNPKT